MVSYNKCIFIYLKTSHPSQPSFKHEHKYHSATMARKQVAHNRKTLK